MVAVFHFVLFCFVLVCLGVFCFGQSVVCYSALDLVQTSNFSCEKSALISR